jgi:hypothetical protein
MGIKRPISKFQPSCGGNSLRCVPRKFYVRSKELRKVGVPDVFIPESKIELIEMVL